MTIAIVNKAMLLSDSIITHTIGKMLKAIYSLISKRI